MQKKQYVDIRTALPDNLLVKSDRITMAHGLEARVPFSDHRLLGFRSLLSPDAVKYNATGEGSIWCVGGPRNLPSSRSFTKTKAWILCTG